MLTPASFKKFAAEKREFRFNFSFACISPVDLLVVFALYTDLVDCMIQQISNRFMSPKKIFSEFRRV